MFAGLITNIGTLLFCRKNHSTSGRRIGSIYTSLKRKVLEDRITDPIINRLCQTWPYDKFETIQSQNTRLLVGNLKNRGSDWIGSDEISREWSQFGHLQQRRQAQHESSPSNVTIDLTFMFNPLPSSPAQPSYIHHGQQAVLNYIDPAPPGSKIAHLAFPLISNIL